MRFATRLMQERGHICEDDVRAIDVAEYEDAQVIEIVLHVALETWANLVNTAREPKIDCPVATAGKFTCPRCDWSSPTARDMLSVDTSREQQGADL